MPTDQAFAAKVLRFVLLITSACLPHLAYGQADVASTKWQAQLEAGEYVLASQEIDQLQDGVERDEALASLALHQASHGATKAATRTALEIRSDLLQFQTLHQWRPFVGGFAPVVGGNDLFGGGINNGFGNALNGVGNPFGPGFADGAGNAGGGVQADFDTLIELITRTVAPESWEDVGGAGTIAEFPTGILIDAAGWMRQMRVEPPATRRSLAVRKDDPALVHVSLPRLEAALLERWALGLPPSEAMCRLDDLAAVEYIVVDPAAHDVVLVGPRATDPSSTSAGRLGDLCVALHNAWQGDGRMVCSITPRQQNLADTQAFLAASSAQPLKPGRRQQWLDAVRDTLGRQDIEFSGIPTNSHTAQVLVAADYHMKLVGMGLRPGVPGVESYLDSIEIQADGTIPAMEVLRWWFTLNTEPVIANAERSIFRLPVAPVRVQSENEMLAEQGVRVHTGASEPLNRRFAASFSEHFAELETVYPIYRELHAIFDLAIVAAVLRDEGVMEAIEWHPTLLASLVPYVVPRYETPREVDSVINHRVLNKTTIVAGISGGVDLSPRRDLARPQTQTASYELDRVAANDGPHEDRHASMQATVTWKW